MEIDAVEIPSKRKIYHRDHRAHGERTSIKSERKANHRENRHIRVKEKR
jgi:hypothetical protein